MCVLPKEITQKSPFSWNIRVLKSRPKNPKEDSQLSYINRRSHLVPVVEVIVTTYQRLEKIYLSSRYPKDGQYHYWVASNPERAVTLPARRTYGPTKDLSKEPVSPVY